MDKGKDTGNRAVKTSSLFATVFHTHFIHWILDTLFGSVFARVPQYSHLQFHYLCAYVQ